MSYLPMWFEWREEDLQGLKRYRVKRILDINFNSCYRYYPQKRFFFFFWIDFLDKEHQLVYFYCLNEAIDFIHKERDREKIKAIDSIHKKKDREKIKCIYPE